MRLALPVAVAGQPVHHVLEVGLHRRAFQHLGFSGAVGGQPGQLAYGGSGKMSAPTSFRLRPVSTASCT
jgi:hypothetical protein